MPPTLARGLVAHAALNLGAGLHQNTAKRSAPNGAAQPLLCAVQPPRPLQLAGLSLGLHEELKRKRATPSRDQVAQGPNGASIPLSQPLGFLLDIDGTLCCSDDIYFLAFKQLLEPHGFVVDEAWYEANVHGKTDAQVFSKLFPEADEKQQANFGVEKDRLFCALYREHCAKHGPPMVKGLAEALEAARELGVRGIAVTNAPRGAAEACIASLRETVPAASIIDKTIVIGAECTRPKPYADPYLKGAELLGLPPSQCIVFEDSGSGVRAGVAAGAREVVGIRSSLDHRALTKAGATKTVQDWREISSATIRRLAGPAPLRQPLGFLLDIDGTLCCSDDIYFLAFKQLLEPHGFVVDEAWYEANVHGKTDAQVFSKLFPEADEKQQANFGVEKDRLFCALYREHCAKHGPPMVKGLAEALEAARELGVRGIAVTNAPRGAAEACIASLRETVPAASIIDKTIVIGAECTRPKPYADPYLKGAELLGLPPSQCIVFEDSGSGVRAGVAAGAREVVGIRSSLDHRALTKAGATKTVQDWREISSATIRRLAGQPPAMSEVNVVGLRGAAKSIAMGTERVAASSLLAAALALGAAPRACAEQGLICQGEVDMAASAARAVGAAMLAILASTHSVLDDSPDFTADARRTLAGAVAASAGLCLKTLLEEGHTMRTGPRRLLKFAVGGSSAACLAVAGLTWGVAT